MSNQNLEDNWNNIHFNVLHTSQNIADNLISSFDYFSLLLIGKKYLQENVNLDLFYLLSQKIA